MTIWGETLGERASRVVLALALVLLASWLPGVRKAFIGQVVRTDAAPGAAPPLAAAPPDAAPLAPAPFVRVVLIDGANLEDARAMPAWSALCARGLDVRLDVGFPTVSLPVQVALWTGLTQQQTGVLFHSGYPLADPLGARGIPAQAARAGGAVAVAETHPYIVQSLGFGQTEPPLGDGKKGPEGWDVAWLQAARAAVVGPARLAFVHVLRVDTAGHKKGRGSPEWAEAVRTADVILGELVAAGDAAHPDARWFVLADHGHVAAGGHGSEARALRVVRGCVAGAGVAPRAPDVTIALVDLSRAIADSLGVTLSPAARGRPLDAALAAPLVGDELVPGPSRGRLALAALILLGAALVTAVALGPRAAWWAPWWWPLALLLAVIGLGAPTLSAQYVFAPKGDKIADAVRIATWAAALWTAAAVHWAGRPAWRVALATVAIPLACLAAALALCGGLEILWGDACAPIAPRWTAWASVVWIIVVRALWAVALALLATSVLPAFDPSAPRGTRRTAP